MFIPRVFRIFLFSTLLATATAFTAEQPTARQIVQKTEEFHQARNESGIATVYVYRSLKSRPRKMKLEFLFESGRTDSGDEEKAQQDDKFLLTFLEPASMKGTSLLTLEHTGRPDDRWVYLPQLKRSRRIADTSKSQSFAGTDFSYEDLRTENFDSNDYELQRKEPLDGIDCYVILAQPRASTPKNQSSYSKRLLWIDAERFLVLKIETFDRHDRHTKTLEQSEWRPVDGKWRFFKNVMTNEIRHSRTVMEYQERKLDQGIDPSRFDYRRLGR